MNILYMWQEEDKILPQLILTKQILSIQAFLKNSMLLCKAERPWQSFTASGVRGENTQGLDQIEYLNKTGLWL